MKKTLSILISAAVIFGLSGCGTVSKPEKQAGANKLQEITIGVLPDVDSIPIVIASEKGYFKDEGLKVNIQHFKSAMDRDSALQAGKIDGAVSDILAAAFAKDGGFDVKITSLTNGSYKLLVGKNSGINSISDLKNKSIAISTNTIIEYSTDSMLEEGGLSLKEVKKIAIPQIPTRLEMLQNGKIDAATLPEPLASEAVKNGARLLKATGDMNINAGVILFTSKAVDTKAEEIKAMYRGYNKAVEYLNKEPISNYIDVLIKESGFPEDIKDVIKLPKYTKAAFPMDKDVDAVVKWLTGKKLIKNSYKLKELADDIGF